MHENLMSSYIAVWLDIGFNIQIKGLEGWRKDIESRKRFLDGWDIILTWIEQSQIQTEAEFPPQSTLYCIVYI